MKIRQEVLAKRTNVYLIGIVISLLLGSFFLSQVQAITSLSIQGSSTLEPVTKGIADSYVQDYVDAEVTIGAEGTGTGIAALLNGQTDIAAASRRIRGDELTSANDSSINDILEVTVALDALSIVTHKDNSIEDLTVAQITGIYKGTYTNWNQVGGPNLGIKLYERDEGSGTHDYFNSVILDGEEVDNTLDNYGAQSQANPNLIAQVKEDKGSITYIGLAWAKDEGDGLNIVKVNGTEPSKETAQDGTYPLARPLYLYLRDSARDIAKHYINYAVGYTGQTVVSEKGYVPNYNASAEEGSEEVIFEGITTFEAEGSLSNSLIVLVLTVTVVPAVAVLLVSRKLRR